MTEQMAKQKYWRLRVQLENTIADLDRETERLKKQVQSTASDMAAKLSGRIDHLLETRRNLLEHLNRVLRLER